jgi:hypothetical protein
MHRTTRRAVLATFGGGVALATAGSVPALSDPLGLRPSDTDLLNFALNLEYVAAEFYSYATDARGVDDSGVSVSGVGAAGATVGGSRVPLSGKLLTTTAHQLARDEAAHVGVLRDLLGGDAVAKPLIDLGGFGMGFRTIKEFLLVARALEDVSVSAYAGILPLVQSKDSLATVARLLAAEAQHAGNLRLLLGLKGLSATSLDAKDVLPPPAGSDVFSSDKSGLAIMRTPQEVLLVLKPFFPRGFNGTLK